MAWKEAANQEDIPVSSSEPQKSSRPSYQFTKSQRFYLPVKRFFDIFFSLLFLLILSPVLLLCMLAIKLESQGPVIFKQERMGKGGKIFCVYKFRTMYTHTPSNVATAEFKSVENYITKVGKILRVTSLDELPQLVNVLKGEMSLIGPRPLILAEKDIHAQRLENGVYLMRPGITGYAQINGRDFVSTLSKVELDTEYLHEFSFWFDVQILFKTAVVVFLRKDYQEGCIEDEDSKIHAA